ncbi:uncharacterized protein LOC133175033 [Saccostrea echinata]|uniref:uncharacterized protein LOC133175033 n=1 Tax=Saccostrea echinata TaxID=191078 RepID=UPI002A81A36B|nr:uncharacterized protein LOC133175033 [Saccostrea echinata]
MKINCRKKKNTDDYQIFEDISYETSDKTSHKSLFDLYLPEYGADLGNNSAPPVAVFVHGGGWRRGDKDTWKHFVFLDINLLAAFIYWCFGLYGNVGKEFARRGVPCAVISYPLTKLKTPWLLLELATSYVGTVIFLGVLFFVLFLSVFVIDFLTPVGIVNLIYRHRELGRLTVSDIFLGHLVLVNLVTLVVISVQRSKHYLKSHRLAALWATFLNLLYAALLTEHPLLTLWVTSFIVAQGALLYMNLKAKDYTHEDQIVALSKCIKKIYEIGRYTNYYDYNSIYLIGHSAGGHLCSLLALRPISLEDIGVPSSSIKGVVAISAVLHVEKLNTRAVRPLYLHPTFGKNPDDWSSACPMTHLQNKISSYLPNFLVITAEKDWHLQQEAAMFAKELESWDIHQHRVVFPRTTHMSIICNFDRHCKVLNVSVASLCVQFIQQTCNLIYQTNDLPSTEE